MAIIPTPVPTPAQKSKVYPVLKMLDGRTLYSDGTKGWTQYPGLPVEQGPVLPKKTVQAPTQPSQSWTPSPSGGNQPSGGGQPTGDSQPAFDEEAYRREQEALLNQQLSAEYDPAISYLSELEKAYGSQRDQAVSNIETDLSAQKPVLQQYEQQEMGELDTQKGKVENTRKSLIEQARDTYNQLQQGIVTRVGGTGSVSQGMQEILSRQTGKDISSYNTQAQDKFETIRQEGNKVKTFFLEKSLALEKEARDRIAEAKAKYDEYVANINLKRGELTGQKAAKKIDALRALSSEIRSIKAEADKFSKQLNLWYQQKNEALSLAQQFGARSFTIPGFSPGGISSFNITRGGTSNTPSYLQGSDWRTEEEKLKLMGLSPQGATLTNKGVSYKWGTESNDDDVVNLDEF